MGGLEDESCISAALHLWLGKEDHRMPRRYWNAIITSTLLAAVDAGEPLPSLVELSARTAILPGDIELALTASGLLRTAPDGRMTVRYDVASLQEVLSRCTLRMRVVPSRINARLLRHRLLMPGSRAATPAGCVWLSYACVDLVRADMFAC